MRGKLDRRPAESQARRSPAEYLVGLSESEGGFLLGSDPGRFLSASQKSAGRRRIGAPA